MGKTKVEETQTNAPLPKMKTTETDIGFKGMEFGGPIGCIGLMIFSHFVTYYFWYCIEFNNASLTFSIDWKRFFEAVAPTWRATIIYLTFFFTQALMAVYVPGLKLPGLPLPHEGGRRLMYHCNAIQCWYVTLVSVVVLHVTGLFRLETLMDEFGGILTVAAASGNLVSILTYFITIAMGKQHRMTGSFIYDFFMGAPLNPRVGSLDLKMFAEARLSWILLFLLTTSAAAKQYQLLGTVTPQLCFMVLAHALYTNAIMKGEECILTTWDIFYEKWGWMLIYWNFAGVPFVYCLQAVYLLKKGTDASLPSLYFTFFLYFVLVFAYYVWDTSQSQRNRFRAMQNGTFVDRKTFPQLPWGTLRKDAKCMKTKAGSVLLLDGWWAYARKIHYTADIIMALCWGLICGFGSFIPYFYFFFFTGMIIHRAVRDNERCARKYKEDWDAYLKKVPYIFIPGIF